MKSNLLQELRKNSRLKMSVYARKNNIPVTTAHFRLLKLQKEIIKKCTSLIDFEKAGFQRWIVLADCNPEEFKEIDRHINNLKRLSKGVMSEIVVKSRYKLISFLSNLSKKKINYSYHPVFEIIKQEELEV